MSRTDLWLWVATAVCGMLTLILSLLTVPPGTSIFAGADKVEHAIAYFVTASLLFLAGVWRPGRGPGLLAGLGWWLPLALIVAGGVVELIQARIGREAEVADWVAEVVAVTAAFALNRRLAHRAEARPA